MIRIHEKGIPYRVKAICRVCGYTNDLDKFKHLTFEKWHKKMIGAIVCPNDDCDSVDEGVYINTERI